ncbi:hypothetical protein KBA39_01700 [Myxococcota bacterium]|nr:hypothetical protein [Myxococcota bacterium]
MRIARFVNVVAGLLIFVPAASFAAVDSGLDDVSSGYRSGLREGVGVPDRYYLVTVAPERGDVAELVRAAGGRVLTTLFPGRVMASFSDQAAAMALVRDFRVRSVSPLSGGGTGWRVDEQDRDAFNGARLALSSSLVEPVGPPLVRDAIRYERMSGHEIPLVAPVVPPDGMVPGLERRAADLPTTAPVLPAWPMRNVVAVTIIMPESDGSIDTNRENWTTQLENAVYNEITSGMAWWPAKASAYGIDLEFKFYSYRPSQQGSAVATGYEPISHRSDEEGLWIGDVMGNLGYNGYYVDAVESFNTYMKNYAEANSAVTVFVANSVNDSNGEFPDGYFAYAHWGGPLIVMTTDNSSYGLSEMSNVIVHEMGHAFYAVDEYYSPGYATCSCDDGYNGCKNRNCADNCGMNVPCMMRYNEDALCADTICHIGWVCRCSAGACCDGCGYRPTTHVCREAVGGCDAREMCPGTGTECPKDQIRPASYKCRTAIGDCDTPEYCDGVARECPDDLVKEVDTVCRESGGDCDVAEKCTGISKSCPADKLLDSSHVCRESGGQCDAAEYCSGKSATCPADGSSGLGAVCRASTGPCDAPEYCSAGTGECPPDAFMPATTVCRAATGPCDTPEYCSGSDGECPPDSFMRADQVCREATGPCDVAEKCDGESVECPADMIYGKGHECRKAAGACDAVEFCDGKSVKCPTDLIYGKGMMCREPATDCDIAEFCTGTGVKCPPNAMYAPGASCDDGHIMTSGDKCSAEGECVGQLVTGTGCSSSSAGGNGGPATALVLLTSVFALLFWRGLRRRRFDS